jgi:hypothetical protein
MRVTMEFQLPEEHCEHLVAVHAMDFALAALDLDEQLRRWMKYGNEFTSADEALEAARQKLHECLADHGVSTEMIP